MPIDFKHATLPNGLTVLAEVDPTAHTSALGFFVKTGARDEAGEVMGVSHFLEHMMFKGTARRTAADVDRDFDDIGADHNAFTTSELTAFHAHCLPEHLPRASEVLCDILRPALRQEDFDSEKSVILEEIAMYEDHPFWVLYEQAMELYYRDHSLRHRVLGLNQTIQSLRRQQMLEYFADRYSADNTVAALAGRVDFDAVVADLAQRCGSWNMTRPQRRYESVRPVAGQFTNRSAKVNRQYALMAWPGPSMQDDRRYPASILSQILGDSEGSRFYWALIETGLAEEAQAQYDGRDRSGLMLAFFACPPESADEVEAVVHQQIDQLIASLTTDDLERVRNKIATAVTLAGERPAGRMRRLGQLWLYNGEYLSLEEELRRINAVTLDDLRDLAEAFPLEPVVTGRLRPEE